MVDKVRPFKMENPASGGSQTDLFPTETDPAEDYVAAKGLALENSDTRLIDLDASGNIQFTDVYSILTVDDLEAMSFIQGVL